MKRGFNGFLIWVMVMMGFLSAMPLYAVGPSATVNSVPIVGTGPVTTANPLPTKLGDGTRAATIKAASTPAAAADPAVVVAISPNGGDPCANPTITKSSAIINAGAATTGSLVAASSGKVIYVCNYTASLAGTTPTVKFIQGTTSSTACDTGAADITGVMAPTSGSIWSSGYGGTVFATSASNALCATTSGESSSFQGRITYVQQ